MFFYVLLCGLIMKESPVKIDVLLEPLLAESSPDQADELLSQLITVHVEPVIKAVIRYKLRFSTNRETQRAEADDIRQEVVLLNDADVVL